MSYGLAAETCLARVEVELEPGRPRVAVPRLADRARVEEPARLGEVDLRAVRREVARRGPVPIRPRARRGCGRRGRAAPPSISSASRAVLGEHVLPDRVARAGVVELGAVALACGLEALEDRRGARRGARSASSARRRRRRCELLEVDRAEHAEVVVADEADRARSRTSSRHLVRAAGRSRPGRRGTRSRPARLLEGGEDGLERV